MGQKEVEEIQQMRRDERMLELARLRQLILPGMQSSLGLDNRIDSLPTGFMEIAKLRAIMEIAELEAQLEVEMEIEDLSFKPNNRGDAIWPIIKRKTTKWVRTNHAPVSLNPEGRRLDPIIIEPSVLVSRVDKRKLERYREREKTLIASLPDVKKLWIQHWHKKIIDISRRFQSERMHISFNDIVIDGHNTSEWIKKLGVIAFAYGRSGSEGYFVLRTSGYFFKNFYSYIPAEDLRNLLSNFVGINPIEIYNLEEQYFLAKEAIRDSLGIKLGV